MWSGRFDIGDTWAAYAGPTDPNSTHAHVALQLGVGVGADLRADIAGHPISARGVLIRPRARHRVAADLDRVGFLYLEPQSPLGRCLLHLCGDAPAVALSGELCDIVATEPRGAIPRLEAVLGVDPREDVLDPRLERALARLAESDGGPGGVARAAAEVGLSASRLRAIARAQLGVPLARWTLWRKLARAARALASGATLADAAATGRFADQAHLARTMREMFGITPRDAVEPLRSRTTPAHPSDSGA